MSFTTRNLLPAYLAPPLPEDGDEGDGAAAVSVAEPGYEVAAKCAAVKALAKALTPESERDDVSSGEIVGPIGYLMRPAARLACVGPAMCPLTRPLLGCAGVLAAAPTQPSPFRPPPLGARRDHPCGGHLHGRARAVRARGRLARARPGRWQRRKHCAPALRPGRHTGAAAPCRASTAQHFTAPRLLPPARNPSKAAGRRDASLVARRRPGLRAVRGAVRRDPARRGARAAAPCAAPRRAHAAVAVLPAGADDAGACQHRSHPRPGGRKRPARAAPSMAAAAVRTRPRAAHRRAPPPAPRSAIIKPCRPPPFVSPRQDPVVDVRRLFCLKLAHAISHFNVSAPRPAPGAAQHRAGPGRARAAWAGALLRRPCDAPTLC
jgi:hypothetical protein